MKTMRFGWLHSIQPLVAWVSMLLLAVTLSLAACNTTRGLGEDVEATGEGIQNAAEEAEEELEEEFGDGSQ